MVLPCPQCLECSGAVELCHKCTINSYVYVIGMVADDFNIRPIIASDVRPVSSGNVITYHMLEVVYSADMVMKKQNEEKFDAELMAVDLDQIVCEYQSTITKKRKAIHAVDFDDGRHRKYTRWNCFKSFWGDRTTVAIPHAIPGKS